MVTIVYKIIDDKAYIIDIKGHQLFNKFFRNDKFLVKEETEMNYRNISYQNTKISVNDIILVYELMSVIQYLTNVMIEYDKFIVKWNLSLTEVVSITSIEKGV